MIKLICFLLCFLPAVPGFADSDFLQGKIEAAIRDYVVNKNPGWSSGSLKVFFSLNKKIAKRFSSYGGEISFTIPEIYPNSRITPNIILPLQVLENGAERERIYVRARLAMYQEVVTASRALKKGDVFGADNLELKEENVLLISGDYFSSPALLLGKQTRGHVSSGAVITNYMVKEIPVIKTNQQIKIFVKSDGLMIEAAGTALEEGGIGDIIKVRRQNSKDVIKGNICSPGKVEVML